MELTPGEKAVLGQVGVLYASDQRRLHLVKSLWAMWPAIDCDVYRRAYIGLLAKGLIQYADDTQAFSITDAGFAALGVTPAAPRATPPARAANRPGERRPAAASTSTSWFKLFIR